MHKLCVYIPQSHLESVKAALFEAGAGKMGDYDCCCWQVSGQGQFRPLDGSSPALGQLHQLEAVQEYRVEMVCDDQCINQVVAALRKAHPYEEPAFDLIKVVDC